MVPIAVPLPSGVAFDAAAAVFLLVVLPLVAGFAISGDSPFVEFNPNMPNKQRIYSFARASFADHEAAGEILDDARVWRRGAPGATPSKLQAWVLECADFTLARDADGRVIGVFLLIGQGQDAEIHLAVSPRAWGASFGILIEYVEWIWKTTLYKRLIGPVPEHNRLARRLALRAGFTEIPNKTGLFEIRKP